jgi:hypothetical protein
MNRDDIQKLLGGYATGTLTAEEQQALFEAALHDQALFDALAREQSLRDLVRDPAAKAQLLAALDEPRPSWLRHLFGWRPAAAMLATAALAVVAAIVVRQRPAPRVEVAQVKVPAAVPTAPSLASEPAPEPRESAKPVANAPAVKHPRQFTPPRAVVSTQPPPPAAIPEPPPVKAESAPAPAAPQLRNIAGLQVVGGAGGITGLTGPPQTARDLFYAEAVRSNFVSSQPAADTVSPPHPQSAIPRSEQPQEKDAAEQNARLGMRAVTAMQAAGAMRRAANPGVRYTVLRRSPDGVFLESDPTTLKSGDIVELRFETNDAGFLTVVARAGGAERSVFAGRMQPHTPVTTVPLRPEEQALSVLFLPTSQTGGAGRTLNPAAGTVQQSAGSTTYVVSAAPSPVSFTITLHYR